ncbi:hypothetical protein GGR56DRAFT_667532 [Xylariaceae sp. FL0804]|nr:hypothetical protein GGR56DRAFT_667532 [Xylariaceae sp. FL0804]
MQSLAQSAAAIRWAPARPGAFSRSRLNITRLRSRRLISIAGVDAPRFLQGLITSSITDPASAPSGGGRPRTGGFYTAFLNAQGRVLHDVFIYPDTLGIGGGGDATSAAAALGQAFLVEVDANQVGELLRHLNRYKLRSKLRARAVEDDELGTWHVPDSTSSSPTSEEEGQTHVPAPVVVATSGATDTIVAPDTRAPGMGHRVLTRTRPQPTLGGGGDKGDVEVRWRLTAAEEAEHYTLRRYRAGVPEGQTEIPRGQALPLEANMDVMGGVDFRKGCYVGQELTIRTRHRGVVRKRVLPVRIYHDDHDLEHDDVAVAAEDLPSGSDLARLGGGSSSGRGARSTGTWLAGIGDVGLALCRLQPMTDLELPGEAAAAAAAPFDPSAEFVVRIRDPGSDTGKEEVRDADEAQKEKKKDAVKIKAYVPDWLRKRLAESGAPGH